MNLREITLRDSAAAVSFIADTDEMIRLPGKEGYEVVSVRITRTSRSLRVKPVLLRMFDGTWEIRPAPPDPAKTLAALVRLAKENLPRQEIGVYRGEDETVRIFSWEKGSFDHALWTIAVHWDQWDARKLSMQQRKHEMGAKPGCDFFSRMARTTFATHCYRKLKLAPAIDR